MHPVTFWSFAIAIGWSLGFLINASARDSDLQWTVEVSRTKHDIGRALSGQHRVLLVGGSHTHYSLSASRLEADLGCPAANLGLHAGLGLSAILEDSMALVRAGDIVVVTPEYRILADPDPGWLAAAFGAATGRLGIGGSSIEETTHIVVAAGMSTLTSIGKSVWVTLTGRSGRTKPMMNRRGDTTVFYGDVQPIGEHQMRLVMSPRRLDDLIRYRDAVYAKGARLVFNLPFMLVASGDEISRLTVENFRRQLEKVAPVVEDDGALNLSADVSRFSDSLYHLTLTAREEWSAHLAKHLLPVIASFGWSCR